MTSILQDAFRHHTWATLKVLDACSSLTDEQLTTSFPGLYGGTLETLRHIVGADAGYLFVITGGRIQRIDEDELDIGGLRDATERHAAAWDEVVDAGLEADAELIRTHDDGSQTRATTGIRLAQAIHHGTDHRSQICTALTMMGMEPPAIDVWDFGEQAGRVHETPPPS
jgi:uncharacterized damage-inducible protein DinB